MGIGRNDLGANLARPKSGGQREGVDVAVHFAIHKNSDPRKMRILISVSVKKYSIIEVMIVDYNYFSVKITIRIIIRIPRINLELYPKADFKAELVSVIFIFRSIVVKCLRGSVILPRSRTWASGPTEPPGRSRPPATR